MKRLLRLTTLGILLGLSAGPAAAAPGNAPTAARPAATLMPKQLPLARQACYLEASKHWDSGVTHDMIQANYAYADCLEAVAVQGLERWFELELLEGEAPKVFLDRMLLQADTLAYVVETGPKACAPSCGTMWQVSASVHRAELLERLLKRMAERLLLESEDSDLLDDARWEQCWKEPERCDKAWLGKS